MEKRNTIFISIFIVVAVIITGISLTYAFIGRFTGNGNILSNTHIKDPSEHFDLTYSGDTNMSLNITLDNLSSLNSSNYYDSYISDTAEVSLLLAADENYFNAGVSCDYEIKYIPASAYTLSPGAASLGLKEFTISGSANGPYVNEEHSIEEQNIAGNSEILLGSYNITADDSNLWVTNIDWHFEMRFYILDVDQSTAIGQTPRGSISIVPIGCDRL